MRCSSVTFVRDSSAAGLFMKLSLKPLHLLLKSSRSLKNSMPGPAGQDVKYHRVEGN